MSFDNIISDAIDSLIRWAAQFPDEDDPSEVIHELACEALPERAEEYLDLLWDTPSLFTESLDNCYSDTLSACDVVRVVLHNLIAGALWDSWFTMFPEEDDPCRWCCHNQQCS